MMGVSFPGESLEYRAARDKLLEMELAQRRSMEAVAAARRALPQGGVVPQDYIFQQMGSDAATCDVTMSELFTTGRDSLVIYSFMYGPDRDEPCPGCTGLLDALNGAADHIRDKVNFVVVAESPLLLILAYADERGWARLRFVSSAGNHYDRDYLGTAPDGTWEVPIANVFQRDGTTIRHFWGSELVYAPTDGEQAYRHNDTIHPLWGMLDYTPEGCGVGHWEPALSYQ
ncbi:DUF899 family protein [Actinomycetes bacterium KLBMP 9759]